METARAENKMGVMPVGKLLISMSVPMMLSMMVQALYNIVDSIFVARISEDALTAVSLAFPIQNLMIAFGVGTGVGVTALVSRHLGEKNFEKANRVATNGLVLSFVTACVCSVLCFFFMDDYFRLLSSDPTITSYGITYTRIVGVICFGIFFQTMFEKLLQSTGKTMLSMYSQMLGACINIVFDPILIFGLLGAPKLGVAGAAIATIMGQIASAIFGCFLNLKKNPEIRLSLRKYPLRLRTVKNIYNIGFPAIIMNAIGSLMNFGMNKILLMFSSTAAAVFGVYFKLQSFVFMPVFGLNNGMTPIVAYNFGAAKPERIKKTIQYAWLVALLITAAATAVFHLMPGLLLKMFSASDNMLAIGVPALRIISIHFCIASVSIISLSTCQALGHGFLSMMISLIRQIGVLLPVSYVLAMNFGLSAIWWSYPIAEIVSAALGLIFLRRMMRTEINPLYLSKD